TDDDIPPSHASRMQREGRGSGNGRAAVPKIQYGRSQNDQIHWFEQEAYCGILRAFKAQSDAITWEKEALLSQLRKELRVSDEEHRELLGRVNADDALRQMREWRQSGGNPGHITNVISAHGPTPSPTVSASQKKQKTAHITSKLHLQPPPPNLHNSPVPSSSGPLALTWNEGDSGGIRGKKSKVGHPQKNMLRMVKAPQVAVPGRQQSVHKKLPGRSSGKNQSTAVPNIHPLIGRKVMTRWPQDNRFYEATITSYNAENGTHALVYDIYTDHETWEWVDLKEMSPSDIRWDGPVPDGFGRDCIKKSIGCRGITSHVGSGRGVLKGQSTMDHRPSQNGIGSNGLRDIELRQTDKLLKEVERVVAVNYPDPVDVERAKKLLKEHELSLLEAIQRLSEVSDGESEDGWNAPSSRTHSADHIRVQSRQNRGNEHASGDEYDTPEDGGGEGSDGEPFVGQYGAASDELQDGDEYVSLGVSSSLFVFGLLSSLFSVSMAFVGFPFVTLHGQFQELAEISEINCHQLSIIFRFFSPEDAEAIENILGDSYCFRSWRLKTDSDIALAFVSFCLLLHPDPTVVEFVAEDEIYPVHRVGLHDQLVDFSLPDPLLWVEEVVELALGSGRGIQWLCGQYRDLVIFAQDMHPSLDHRFLPSVDIDAALFSVDSAIDNLNALKDRAGDAFSLLLKVANERAATSHD
ncbi:hypothetical protein KI387_016307, partial [Taxus chinensis]